MDPLTSRIPDTQFNENMDYVSQLMMRNPDGAWSWNNFKQYLLHIFDGLTRNSQIIHIIDKEMTKITKEIQGDGLPDEKTIAINKLIKIAEILKRDITPQLTPLAEAKSKPEKVHASYALGTIYEKGWGVASNIFQASTWYGKSAELGSKEALAALERLAVVDWYAEAQLGSSYFKLASQVNNELRSESERTPAQTAMVLGIEDQQRKAQQHLIMARMRKEMSEAATKDKPIDLLKLEQALREIVSKMPPEERRSNAVLAAICDQISDIYENGFGGVKQNSLKAAEWRGKATQIRIAAVG
jgi:hypothetical protein